MVDFVDVIGDDPFYWVCHPGDRIVAVVGSRRRNTERDREQVLQSVVARLDRPGRLILVSGGCPIGADRHVEQVAEATGILLVRFLPRAVSKNAPYFMHVRALFDRNTRVAQFCHETLAQVTDDRMGGTEDAVRKAHEFGRRVVLLTSSGDEVAEEHALVKSKKKTHRNK